MRLRNSIVIVGVLLSALTTFSYAENLNIVLLDSNDNHPLRGKLVCIWFRSTDSNGPVVEKVRDCHRTDSVGTATFNLPDPSPEKIEVAPSSNGLVACFTPHTFAVADALKTGMVADNTCGDASTDTTQTGELVLYVHQKGIRETVGSVRNEF